MSNTCGCSRPTRSGYVICDTCKGELEQHLAEMAWLDKELDVSLTRSKGIDYRALGGSRGASTPLPFNERAAKARDALKGELVSWFRLLWVHGEDIPADDLPSIAAWLQSRLGRIVKREDAWSICETIVGASAEARSFVFAKPADKVFWGKCKLILDFEEGPEECGGELFARGDADAICDQCDAVMSVAEAKRELKAKASGSNMTANEIGDFAHQVMGLSAEKVERIIGVWASPKRKRLLARGKTKDGVRMFNVGEVVALLDATYGRGA